MRTTLDIDERLLKEAMARSQTRTKTETVERGLQALIRLAQRERLLAMQGQGYGMRLSAFLRHRADE